MTITTTRAAFIELLNQRGIYKKLVVARSRVSHWKKYLKDGTGESITIDRMEQLLLVAGATVVQEKVWEVTI